MKHGPNPEARGMVRRLRGALGKTYACPFCDYYLQFKWREFGPNTGAAATAKVAAHIQHQHLDAEERAGMSASHKPRPPNAKHAARTEHPREYCAMFQDTRVLHCTAYSDAEALDIIRQSGMAEMKHLQRLDNGSWVWVI